jgi:sarcosine oxidase
VRVCVIGLGAMGVAATRVLAERGHEVVGIDRHGVANDLGSSAHGQRIFRLAHDRSEYVRLARRALLHWRDLERRDGAALLRATGLLEVGGPHDEIVAALRAEHATVVELDGAEAPDLFPGLAPRLGRPARWQPAAGVLSARDCLLVQADLAARAGAEIATGENVLSIEATSDRAIVRSRLRRIDVDVAVVAAGPWLNELLRPLGLEQPLESALGQASIFRGSGWDQRPCLIEWDRDGVEASYGMPVGGSGYKLGLNATNSWQPEDDERRPDHAESLVLSRRVTEGFVGLGPRPTRTERCPVTTTPDGGFLADRRGAVVVAGGCSGHGFMFSPALGELIADLVEGSRSPEPFRIDRPGLHPARLIS